MAVKLPLNELGATNTLKSGEHAANAHGLGQTIEAHHEGGQTHIDLLFLGEKVHLAERFHDDILQPGIDVLLAPELGLNILHPFKIAHRDAARVG